MNYFKNKCMSGLMLCVFLLLGMQYSLKAMEQRVGKLEEEFKTYKEFTNSFKTFGNEYTLAKKMNALNEENYKKATSFCYKSFRYSIELLIFKTEQKVFYSVVAQFLIDFYNTNIFSEYKEAFNYLIQNESFPDLFLLENSLGEMLFGDNLKNRKLFAVKVIKTMFYNDKNGKTQFIKKYLEKRVDTTFGKLLNDLYNNPTIIEELVYSLEENRKHLKHNNSLNPDFFSHCGNNQLLDEEEPSEKTQPDILENKEKNPYSLAYKFCKKYCRENYYQKNKQKALLGNYPQKNFGKYPCDKRKITDRW